MKSSLNQIVILFSAAEIVVWATIYYMFPAMILTWEEGLGWDRIELAIGYSLALGISALLAPAVGKWIDSGYAKQCMAGGAVLGAVLLVLLSGVDSLSGFYLIWLGLGVVIALTHYDACFVVITRYLGSDSRTVITRITLVAGFAGMISFPSTHYLNFHYGWETTMLVYAIVLLLVGAPLHWIACGKSAQYPTKTPSDSELPESSTKSVLRDRRFWLLGIAFALISLDHGVIISHILPILSEKGVGIETAVLVASLIGPMQIVGRLGMVTVETRLPLAVITIASYVVMIAAAFSVLGITAFPLLVFVFAVLQGAGYGVTSILRPVVTAELLGRNNFGVISGMLTVPYMAGFAIAPTFGSILWETGGYDLVIVSLVIALVVGLVCMHHAWKSNGKMSR